MVVLESVGAVRPEQYRPVNGPVCCGVCWKVLEQPDLNSTFHSLDQSVVVFESVGAVRPEEYFPITGPVCGGVGKCWRGGT